MSDAKKQRGLACTREFLDFQREWFASIQYRASQGTPIAVVGVDTPHEILTALDMPFVVAPWWSSVCSAKQKDRAFFDALTGHGYPNDQTQYIAMGFASALAPEHQPWGGLPTPSLFVSNAATGPEHKIMQLWAAECGAELFTFERTTMIQPVSAWWERIDRDWESLLRTSALDLMESEIAAFVQTAERIMGRALEPAKLARVINRANEHGLTMREASEVLASCPFFLADVSETIPATTIPQWHAGSEWGLYAATKLKNELVSRRDSLSGEAEPHARLLWLGNPPWFDMNLFERLTASTNSYFVWNMYLAIAGDGYVRETSPETYFRSLAARHGPHRDLLSSPPWNSTWIAKEAKHYKIDGAVHFVTDGGRGKEFIRRELEASGVPVLEIEGDAVDNSLGPQNLENLITEFIHTLTH